MACRLPLLLSCVLLAAASWTARAAELGEPRVRSYIGQPLVADIELIMLEDPGPLVQVRLANANVYRGANAAMPAVLSTLSMTVMRRDGRQFLHVTSLRPVESEHLHLYLELVDGSQRSVRLATLWLSPDPHPAPVPTPIPAALPPPAKAAEPILAPKPRPAPTPKPAPRKDAPPRVAAAIPAPAVAPRKAAEAAPSKPEAVAVPVGASCAPQAPREVDACAVLDAKNAMLRAQLGQLEDKVKVLQVAAGAPPALAAAPVKVHKPKKKQPEPPVEEDTPWLLAGAGAGVLALLAGLALAVRRRRGRARAAEPRVGLGARLAARIKPKAAPARVVEPTLDERAHESSTQL